MESQWKEDFGCVMSVLPFLQKGLQKEDFVDSLEKSMALMEKVSEAVLAQLTVSEVDENGARADIAFVVSQLILNADRPEDIDPEIMASRIVALAKSRHRPTPEEVFEEVAPVSKQALLVETHACLSSLDGMISAMQAQQRKPELNLLTGNEPAAQFGMWCCQDLLSRAKSHGDNFCRSALQGGSDDSMDVYGKMLPVYAGAYKRCLEEAVLQAKECFNKMNKPARAAHIESLRTSNPLREVLTANLNKLDTRWSEYMEVTVNYIPDESHEQGM